MESKLIPKFELHGPCIQCMFYDKCCACVTHQHQGCSEGPNPPAPWGRCAGGGWTQADGRTVAIKKVEIFDMAVKKRERCLQVRSERLSQRQAWVGSLDACAESFFVDGLSIVFYSTAPVAMKKSPLPRPALRVLSASAAMPEAQSPTELPGSESVDVVSQGTVCPGTIHV